MSDLVSAHIRQLVLSLPEDVRPQYYAAVQASSNYYDIAHLPGADRLLCLYPLPRRVLSERDRSQLLCVLYDFR